MPGLGSLHEPKPHRGRFPAGRQSQSDIARREEALPLRIPDLEHIAGPLELRALLPAIEVDPLAQGPLPSKMEIRRLQEQDLEKTDLKIGHCVAVDVAGQHAVAEFELSRLAREGIAADERERLVA
jgi:hypothetical protein